jgi:hypothetical protein
MSLPLRSLAISVALAMSSMPAAHAEADKPSQYGIKNDLPTAAFRLRPYAVGPFNLPINKQYHELSASEKQELHSYYEHMGEGDEPPFPAEGLRPLFRAISKGQQQLLVEGDLFLIADVDTDGAVTSVKAIGSPSEDMTKFAASVLMLTKFKPALCKGQPCKMQFPLSFRFKVE